MRRLPIAFAAMLLAAGCGGSEITKIDTTRIKPPADTVAASITAAGVVNQSAPVGTALPSPITVVVKNKAGDPLQGETVTFAVTSGGGMVGSPSVSTDAQGSASSSWTLGPTAGTQTATATVQGLPAVTFTATATAGAAAVITKVAGDSQSVVAGTAVPVLPTVKITDAGGNPVSGTLVSFTIASGGGTVTGGTVNTAADGTAHVGAWTLGKTAGPNTLLASAGGLSATFSATAVAGPATSVQFTTSNPATLVPGQTTRLTVKALDANGNTVTTAPSFSSSNTAAVTVDASGTVTGVGAGSATVTATVDTAHATRTFTVVGHSGSIIYDTTAVANSPQPAAVALGNAFVGQTTGTHVTRLAPNGTVVADIDVTSTPVDVAADQAGTVVVVATTAVNQLSVLNLSQNSVAGSVALPAAPLRLVLSSDSKTAYVGMNNGQLAIVDIPSRTLSYLVGLNLSATALRLAPGDTLLYAGGGNTISAVNVRTRLTSWTQSIPGSVGDIEISNDGAYLYIANSGSGGVDLFRISNLSVAGTYDIGGGARTLTKTPDGQELYVVQTSLARVTAMVVGAGTSLFPSRNVPTGGLPTRVVFEPSGTWAVIPNASGWVNFIH